MKKESLQAIRDAYVIARDCIEEMIAYIDVKQFGKTKELLPIVDICNARGVSIITVTENIDSPLAQAADVVLKQHVNKETDKWNAQETGYQAAQFALIYPGGAVGERLNNRVL